MQKLGLNEIRERYLAFFESKGHLRLPSFPLVPQNDASLLLVNAGMAPLKPYFTGKEVPPSKRVTTCQKCIRTPDIERVGKTARHGTYFEMLGNFSFGDYFKNEATAWAWEFITKEMEMPIDRLWVSIYEEDEEAGEIWVNNVGVAADRIVRLGKADNFWEIGTGPCGPCSEIYYDRGVEAGCGSDDCAVGCDCDRFVEFWNLVFTQFDKDDNGNYNRLAKPNIDTGMGMERLAAIMQGVNNLFEVDTVRNIMLHVCKLAGIKYGEDSAKDVSLRVITDHIRGTTFMICDGVLPSNEGRGYVLRRLIRRAARHGKIIGIKETFLHKVVETVISENAVAYSELLQKSDYIKKVVRIEEENFDKTIDQGLAILNDYIAQIGENNILSGENAFKLYDTYGFPIDLTIEIATENKIEVDIDGFNDLMNKQRERARSARSEGDSAGWDDGIYSKLDKTPTEFVGYNNNECEAKVIAIVKDNELIENAQQGDDVVILLHKTVFYGESGGQVGDIGQLVGNCIIDVFGTQKLADGKILHKATIKSGVLEVGEVLTAKIDIKNRRSIASNHSATHILQKALQGVLGSHVSQSGSLVTANRLRFDFTHFSAMTNDELLLVENMVNEQILNSLNVDIADKSIDEAKKMGAMALFGEKYGSTVRVVKMGDYSLELCGGCHISNTSQIGLFKIASESGVAAGVRRIEAVTGISLLQLMRSEEAQINEVAGVLKTTTNEIVRRAEGIVSDLKNAQREIESLKGKLAGGSIDALIEGAVVVGNTSIVVAKMDDLDISGLQQFGDKLRDKLPNSIVVLATTKDDKINFIAMATKKAVEKGAHCGNIVREVAKIAGGGGGGKPDSAQAGGKDITKVDEALKSSISIASAQLK